MDKLLSARQRRPSMAKRKKRRIGAFSRRLSLADLDLRTNAGKFGNSIKEGLDTHDVGVAVEIADRVAIMYAGRIVESGRVHDILRDPGHPYTQGLLASTLRKGERGRRLAAIPGAPPDLAALPPGCTFAPRCPHVEPACRAAIPPRFRPAVDREILCRLPKKSLARTET